jgi:hypothetical protein
MLVLGLLAMIVVPAAAITNGQPDGNNHPYVGLMVAQDSTGNPLWRCSGTLISEGVFLTAGHCVEPPAAHVEIWFASGSPAPIPLGAGYPAVPPAPNRCSGITGYPCTGDVGGDPYPHPDFCIGCGNGLPGFATHDVGIVVLDTAHPMSNYGVLPDEGDVDGLKNKTAIDFVGYGVNEQVKAFPGQNPFDRWVGFRTRMFAPSELVSGNFVHSAEFLKLALNPGGGSGGTCFGDSGGPDLLANTRVVLGVNSYVTNVNCSGVGYSTRVDNHSNLAFITSFLP